MATKRLTPIQAIKAYCKQVCCCGDTRSWKECPNTRCCLYSYRLGKRPTKLPFEAYCTKKPLDSSLNSVENAILEAGKEAKNG